MNPSELEALERKLGYFFVRKSLLIRALTHSSLSYEHQQAEPGTAVPEEYADNEQLELLGDAVVGLITAESLLRRYPALDEGALTRLRASLVSRRHLGQVAARLQLGPFLRLGRGEERSGGRRKQALLANAMEAVLGAIYLDGGLSPAAQLVEREVIAPSVEPLRAGLTQGSGLGDYKSALQERLQARKAGPPQ